MMRLNKLSQTNMILMIIIELVLLSLLGASLISFVNLTTNLDDFKLKTTARDIALIMSTMYSLQDDVNVTYETPFENKYYNVSADGVVVKAYSLKEKNLEKIFPYIHHKDTKTYFPGLRLISINISKVSNNFYAQASFNNP